MCACPRTYYYWYCKKKMTASWVNKKFVFSWKLVFSLIIILTVSFRLDSRNIPIYWVVEPEYFYHFYEISVKQRFFFILLLVRTSNIKIFLYNFCVLDRQSLNLYTCICVSFVDVKCQNMSFTRISMFEIHTVPRFVSSLFAK